MTVMEGEVNIMAAGGILFLLASISVYQKSFLMFNYGLAAAVFLVIPKVLMMYAEHTERKKLRGVGVK